MGLGKCMDADTEERPAKKTRMYDSDQDGAPAPAPPRLPAEVVSTPSISTSALRSVLKGAVFACACRSSLDLCTCKTESLALVHSVRGAGSAKLCATLVRLFAVYLLFHWYRFFCVQGLWCQRSSLVTLWISKAFSSERDVSCCMCTKLTLACLHRQMRPQRSTSGSAFIIDADSRWIMTNAHVVRLLNCKAAYLASI